MEQAQDMQQLAGSAATWEPAAGGRLRAISALLLTAAVAAGTFCFRALVLVWKVLVALGSGGDSD